MPKAKQQPDNDQITVTDPNDPDVVAYAAAGPSEAAQNCPVGSHWDGSKCVADDLEQPQQ